MPSAHFDPTQTYSTVTDIEGNIFAFQNNLYYDKFGNSWPTVPKSKQGWTGPTAPASGGSFSTITGQPTDNTALAAALAGKQSVPTAWAASAGGGTPTLTSGTAVLGTAFRNTTAGTTALSPAIDGITSVNLGDVLVCLTAGTYTLSPALDSSGYLEPSQVPAFTGDVTTPGGSLTTTLSAAAPVLNQQTTNAQVGTTYTLVLTDAGKNIDMNNASANTLTIPLNASVAFPQWTLITVTMAGAGLTTIAGAGGVTLVKPTADSLTISAQYRTATLYKVATDTWRVNAN